MRPTDSLCSRHWSRESSEGDPDKFVDGARQLRIGPAHRAPTTRSRPDWPRHRVNRSASLGSLNTLSPVVPSSTNRIHAAMVSAQKYGTRSAAQARSRDDAFDDRRGENHLLLQPRTRGGPFSTPPFKESGDHRFEQQVRARWRSARGDVRRFRHGQCHEPNLARSDGRGEFVTTRPSANGLTDP